jgi:hypothetical protein
MPFSYNPLLGVGLDKSIPLDGAGKIPSTFLPSYVDDVEEYNNLAAFPATGETGKIYVAINTGFVYRWSGSIYVQIGVTAAAGSTTQVQFNDAGAFGGDAGLVFDKTTDALTIAGPVVHPLGAAATPSLTFTGDPNTGIYSPGADQVAISTNAVERVEFGTSEVVFNDGGTNYDFRIEGDTNANLFFVDASTDRVGIGTTSPRQLLTLGGVAATSTATPDCIDLGATYSNTAGANMKILTYSDGIVRHGIGVSTAASDYLTANSGAHVFYRGTTETARIDSSGRLLVGTSSGRSTAGLNARLQVEGTSAADSTLTITSNSATAHFALAHTGSAAVGSTALVANNDICGRILFSGTDGTNAIPLAFIDGVVDGTPGSNDMPGRLVFSTTPDGSASPTERLRITSAGVLQVADAGNITVGTTTGTKIGTATTQKLGFYNATPVVQPAAVADATTAVDVITQLNDLLAKLRTLGIIAT